MRPGVLVQATPAPRLDTKSEKRVIVESDTGLGGGILLETQLFGYLIQTGKIPNGVAQHKEVLTPWRLRNTIAT